MNESLFSCQSSSTNAYGNSDRNYPKLETDQMSFNRWMNKQNLVPPYNGVFFSKKKNELLTHSTTRMKLKCIVLSEGVSEHHRLYYSIYMICLKKLYYQRTDQGLPGLRGGVRKWLYRGSSENSGSTWGWHESSSYWLHCCLHEYIHLLNPIQQYLPECQFYCVIRNLKKKKWS